MRFRWTPALHSKREPCGASGPHESGNLCSIPESKRVMFFLLQLAVLASSSGFAQAPAPSSLPQPPPSYRFSSGDATLNIPVELVANGLVFVQAKVNGHPGWFILDNASQGFLVDREYARQISLQTTGSAVSRNDVSDAVRVGIIRD